MLLPVFVTGFRGGVVGGEGDCLLSLDDFQDFFPEMRDKKKSKHLGGSALIDYCVCCIS